MFDKSSTLKMNEVDRRRFMGQVASSLLGVTAALWQLMPWMQGIEERARRSR